MQPSQTLRSAFPLVLFVILAASAAWACFGERGIIVNNSLTLEIDSRESRIEERRGVIAHLHQEIENLRSDPRVQERWVREELGYVRPGEIVFVFASDRGANFEMLNDRRLPASAGAQAPLGEEPKEPNPPTRASGGGRG